MDIELVLVLMWQMYREFYEINLPPENGDGSEIGGPLRSKCDVADPTPATFPLRVTLEAVLTKCP
jgi:hypothetical protein